MNTDAVFIDTAPIIYFVEQQPEFGPKTKNYFSKLFHNSNPLFSSHLTLAEVLVKPFQKNPNLAGEYHDFFQNLPNFNFVFLSQSTAILTAQIRAKYGFRFVDSANLALAVESECTFFLTNDTNLKSFPDLNVTLISEL